METTVAPSTVETPNAPLKRGLAWAGLAAIGGCAAMCSLPLFAAGVLGGSAITAGVARFVTPGAAVAVGSIVFVVVLATAVYRARARARPDAAAAIPIACDPFVFSKDERKAHHELARNVIARWPTQREELADGFQFHYTGNEERFLALARWVSSEHRCCSWAAFSLEMEPFTKDAPGAIRLQMRGPGDAKKLLADAFTMLDDDARADMFLHPTGTITAQTLGSAKSSASRGCGC